MKSGRASLTAQRVALRRAAHQVLDVPRVFDDPLALRIVGPDAAAGLRGGRQEAPMARYLRAFMAVRSRYAEDQLTAAVAAGARQYVVLGAGLDTFAYRNPWPGLRVFEVDHPATQALKRDRLREAGIGVPETLTFVPVDFGRASLAEGLSAAGFAADAVAFFSWLGVTQYLAADEVRQTLRSIAEASCKGSAVVFDYAISPSLLSLASRAVFSLLAARVAAAGEPWRSSFVPEALAGELRALGFGDLEDVGPDELNRRYFEARTDGLKVGSLAHLMKAVVAVKAGSRREP